MTEMKEKKEMNVCWLFLDRKEIWVRCKECGEPHKIRQGADISKFRPKPENPIIEICPNTGKEIIIERVWFARKGMKELKK